MNCRGEASRSIPVGLPGESESLHCFVSDDRTWLRQILDGVPRPYSNTSAILLCMYLECCVLTRLARLLCCEHYALLGKETGENVSRRLALLELVMHMQHQGLNERLGLLATRLPDGFDGQVTFRR